MNVLARFVIAASGVIFIAAGCLPAQQLFTPNETAWNPRIDPAEFQPTIDNPFLPWSIGASWTYEARTEEGLEKVVVTVLTQTRMVMGVETRIVRDTVWVNGALKEDTYDWYAQKEDGSVWYFGEETAEYEDGEVVSTRGSWEAGVDGALPGIVMPADPRVGDKYYEEYYVGEAEDEAEVVEINVSVDVAYGAFHGCVKTHNTTALDASISEFKTYCEGVGQVLTEEGDVREELVSFED